MHRLARAIFLIAGVAILLPSHASAQAWTPCEAYGHADVVFSGTAGARVTRWLEQRGRPNVPSEQTPFTVERWFRGEGPGVVYVADTRFTVGERYLVYGTNYADGPAYLANESTGSKRLADAHADVQFLSAVTDSQGGAIMGRVLERINDLTAGQMIERPAPHVALVVKGPGGSIDVTPNPDGSYIASGLAPGVYRITAALADRQRTLSDPATIKNGGCVKADVRVLPNGRVRGQVIAADGRPLGGQTVDLVPADVSPIQGHIFAAGSVSADYNGRFEFDGRSPGRYFVGVNLLYAPTPASPYRSAYYPGTPSRADAQVIEVGYGSIVEGAVVQVGPRLPVGRLAVIVQAPEGAGRVKACIMNDAEPMKKWATWDAPPPPKSVSESVVADLPYRIKARFVLGGQHYVSDDIVVQTTSERVVVTATPNRIEATPRWGEFCSRDPERD